MTNISFTLDDEQLAMLDSFRQNTKKQRGTIARELLAAVLEDDAASHQGVTSSPDKIIYLRNWRGAR